MKRPSRDTAGGLRALFGRFGEAEIEELHHAFGGDFDVGGFEVAVDDSLFVGGFEGRGDLARVSNRGLDGQRPFQIAALDHLHHDGPLLDGVDGSNIRVVEGGELLGFALEALHAGRVRCEGRRKDLEGDFPAEPGVGGSVDFAHTASAEFGGDAVVSDRLWSHPRVMESYHLRARTPPAPVRHPASG
jgi:hypothetical protein